MMFQINVSNVERLQTALEDYQGDAETAINDVLHNEGGALIQEQIYRLMPESGKTWKGKKGAAKKSNSLRNTNGNLSVTVRSQKAYQYLYFPDDGTNTRRHVGNQQFFVGGAEAATNDIIDRCITKLTNTFEKGV